MAEYSSHHGGALLAVALCLSGCGWDAGAAAQKTPVRIAAVTPTCEIVEAGGALPDEVRETSGLARSTRGPDLFWTHNDAGNEPYLFAVDAAGRLVQRVRVTGAELIDWEDLETAPCGAGSCLYVGDIGDNDGNRERITIYRVPEPEAASTETAPADALHARFPDGPRDAEALFNDRSGTLHVITKGRSEEIALYRYPPPQRTGETVVLERVRELFPRPQDDAGRVTAASATPDGRWVGIRTYRTLYLYRAEQLLADSTLQPAVIDLTPLGEAQGESLVLSDDGTVWLSSEAASRREQPRWSRLRCNLGIE
jgi:hypothetical protein